MKLVPATPNDLPDIMSIIRDAQSLLAAQHIDQWQNGYPTESILLKDIMQKECYVLKSKNYESMATAMFSTRGEPTYSKIEGQWKTETKTKYGVIHRMAVDKNHRGRGLAKFIIASCEQWLLDDKITSMRIDTHKDNLMMQHLLKQQGYNYCGIIYLDNGDKRLAFEKIL